MERCPNCQACEVHDTRLHHLGPCGDEDDGIHHRCNLCGHSWPYEVVPQPPPCPIHTQHEVGQTFIGGKPICKHCGQFKEEWR